MKAKLIPAIHALKIGISTDKSCHPANAYGAMGALVLAMLWVYYASIILFVGAVVTATVDERMGKLPEA